MSKKWLEWGNLYSKPDIERLGIFTEMPYLRGKYKIKQKIVHELPNAYGKGPNGLFQKEYQRIFIGEAIKGRGRKRPKYQPSKGLSTQPFVPTVGTKLHSCPGDSYGCFGKVEYFSRKPRAIPPYVHQNRNFYTSPAKKGNTGYVKITISPYPVKEKPDPYATKSRLKPLPLLNGPLITNVHPKDYFDNNPFKDPPNIKPGTIYKPSKTGAKEFISPGFIRPAGPGTKKGEAEGISEKWPEHKVDKYYRPPKRETHDEDKQPFFPHSRAPKSFYNTSIVNQNVDLAVTQDNYQTVQPTYTSRLLAN